MDKSLIAQLLDVELSTLSEFDQIMDPFNKKTITGYLCSQSDHRYGSLVITRVDNIETKPQIIYCTPKLHYPFNRGVERTYHFPKFRSVNVYEKLDGTNICCYSYVDHLDNRFVTFKTRLVPVLSETGSEFGNFYLLWNEMLQKHPELRIPECVQTGEYTLSYELYGYRNHHLITYKVDLDTKLLFGIKQLDHSVIIPEHFSWNPCILIKETSLNEGNITEFYEALRKKAQDKNKIIDEENIEGTEGYVFYVLTEDNQWIQYKLKPESVESIHWAQDSLPMNVIVPTVKNSLENDPNPTFETIRKLLLEEFTASQVDKSSIRIQKAIQFVKDQQIFKQKIKSIYDQIDENTRKEGLKAPVMRAMSKHFKGPEMKKVFQALLQLGISFKDDPKHNQKKV